MRFNQLPMRLRALIVVQAVLAVVAACALWTPPRAEDAQMLAFLALCGIIGGVCKVDVDVRLGRLTLGFTIAYFALLLLGIPAAMLVGLVGAVAGTVFNLKEEKRWANFRKLLSCQSLYNCANGILATAAMGGVYQSLGGKFGQMDLLDMSLPILVSSLTYYLVNTGGVTLAIGWSQNRSALEVFRNHFAWSWPGYVGGASISAALIWLHHTLGIASPALVILPPAYTVYYLYNLRMEKARGQVRHIQELNRLNEAIISSLAMAIEAKDRHTGRHVSRVREYALALARKLGVAADELQAIGIASLLHDIGKIGIPERILCKPGKLTPEEFEIIKSHVEIGVVILEQVRFPWPVVPIVWTHHERWDGLGYPAGLKTEAIPMGGRIISLVDVFDALTSDRPYRQAIPRDKALEILRSSSGTQFDPKVVETFIEILPEVDALLEAKEASAAADTDAPFPLLAEDIAPGSGWQQAEADALLQELAEGLRAEQLPEAMAARLAEGISRMVPFSTFAVYLTVPPSLGGSAHPALVPLYSSGLWTELLDGMEIRVGEGVSGTVAATATPLMNVQASLDLARRVRPGDNLELNSTLCVPLLVDGAVTGTITLYHSAYNLYQPEHLEFLTQVAAAAAPALARTGSRDEKMPLDESPMTALPASFSVSQLLHRHITLAQSRNEEPV